MYSPSSPSHQGPLHHGMAELKGRVKVCWATFWFWVFKTRKHKIIGRNRQIRNKREAKDAEEEAEGEGETEAEEEQEEEDEEEEDAEAEAEEEAEH